MCDKELIVAYLYGEVPAAERQAIDAHLAVCPECRIELEELRATRNHLALWAPPEPDLGFRLIRAGAEPVPVPSWRQRFVPAFGFAAAATIVLAAALAIANVEVRYGNDGVTVRTGWASQGAARSAEQTAVSERAPADTASGDRARTVAESETFAAVDRRLRELEAAFAKSTPEPSVQTASGARMSDAEMLKQVRRIISESEARQETANARRLLQVIRDFDTQRRADIALIQQGLGDYQGLTNAEIAQTRERLNQFILAASRQEK